MKHLYIDQEIKYDGRQLHSLWAFRTFGLHGDSIVAWQGPCAVQLTEMVDQEDVRQNAPIFSQAMLHFIVEHFHRDLEKAVWQQRLLIALIGERLNEKCSGQVKRHGDDLYLGDRKLSVSIATLSPVSALIHVGLNVSSEGTPVPTVSLPELGVGDIKEFAETILQDYVREVEGINYARCKVRGVD